MRQVVRAAGERLSEQARADTEPFCGAKPDIGIPVAACLPECVRCRWLDPHRAVSPLITGSADRSRRNAETMRTTLDRLEAAGEQP